MAFSHSSFSFTGLQAPRKTDYNIASGFTSEDKVYMKLTFRFHFLGVEWITFIRIMFNWRDLVSIPLALIHPKELLVVRGGQ